MPQAGSSHLQSPICLRCGSPLSGDLVACFHRCDSCLHDLRSRPHAFDAPEGLIVRAAFSPGFAEDLTGWETSFFADGRVQQSIRWYAPIHGKGQSKTQTTSISVSEIASANSVLRSIDISGLAILKQHIGIDDAPIVHLFSPSLGIHVAIDQWDYSDDRIPIVAKSAVDTFQRAWTTLDSLSPYTLRQHRKGGITKP